jgi:branched-chain amino acid transport system ATP-binding protein
LTATTSEAHLEVRGLSVHFEGVKAVDGIDLDLRQGEILGLIGPNGAGKTTLVNALTGFQRPTAGTVRLAGEDITRLPAEKRTRRGLVRTFQAVRLFSGLTVQENVAVVAAATGMNGREAQRLAATLLEDAGLGDLAELRARGIPAGMERRLGIVRALAARPRFLLLDEPAAGLNEQESDDLVTSLAAVRDRFGCGLLVIEHDMRVIMRLCERIQVIDYGKTISIGTPAEVQSDPAVITAYLGTERKLASVDV